MRFLEAGGGMDLTLAADVSEFFWSLDKPALAELPLFVGGRWVNQTLYFLGSHL
jgi:hypothetical protein